MTDLDYAERQRRADARSAAALADSPRAPGHVVADRLAICRKCPKLLLGACEALPCKPEPILTKTAQKASRCPLKRWPLWSENKGPVPRSRRATSGDYSPMPPPLVRGKSSQETPAPATCGPRLRGVGLRVMVTPQTGPRRESAKGRDSG